jgi:hypothetical protein
LLEVFKLNKNIQNSAGEVVPTYSGRTKVVFAGTVLPHYIEVDKCLLPVKIFYPAVMACEKCSNFNHTATYCKNKCKKCKTGHKEKECPKKDEACPYCSQLHAELRDCSSFKALKEQQTEKSKRRIKTTYAQALAQATSSNPFVELSAETRKATGSSNRPIAKPRRKHAFKTTKNTESLKFTKLIDTNNKKRRVETGSDMEDDEDITMDESSEVPPGMRSEFRSTISSVVEKLCDSFNLPPQLKEIVINIIVPIVESLMPKLREILSSIVPLLFNNF